VEPQAPPGIRTAGGPYRIAALSLARRTRRIPPGLLLWVTLGRRVSLLGLALALAGCVLVWWPPELDSSLRDRESFAMVFVVSMILPGLALVTLGVTRTLRILQLLRVGELTEARLKYATQVSNAWLAERHVEVASLDNVFEYDVGDTSLTRTVRRPQRLPSPQLLLYHPVRPEVASLVCELPRRVRFDSDGQPRDFVLGWLLLPAVLVSLALVAKSVGEWALR